MKIKLNILILFIFFNITTGVACSCVEVHIDSSFNYSSLIFKGKVKEIIKGKLFTYQGSTSYIVNFEIVEGFKNAKVDAGMVSIISDNSGCDFLFEENKEYIVFANKLGCSNYSTSICTKTAQIDDFHPDDLKRIKKLSKNHIDDLYNHPELMLIEPFTYDALIKENEDHKSQIQFLMYLIVSIVLGVIIYILVVNKAKTSS